MFGWAESPHSEICVVGRTGPRRRCCRIVLLGESWIRLCRVLAEAFRAATVVASRYGLAGARWLGGGCVVACRVSSLPQFSSKVTRTLVRETISRIGRSIGHGGGTLRAAGIADGVNVSHAGTDGSRSDCRVEESRSRFCFRSEAITSSDLGGESVVRVADRIRGLEPRSIWSMASGIHRTEGRVLDA